MRSIVKVSRGFASSQPKEILLAAADFTELLKVKDIPPFIIKKLSEIAEDQDLTMANPGEVVQLAEHQLTV